MTVFCGESSDFRSRANSFNPRKVYSKALQHTAPKTESCLCLRISVHRIVPFLCACVVSSVFATPFFFFFFFLFFFFFFFRPSPSSVFTVNTVAGGAVILTNEHFHFNLVSFFSRSTFSYTLQCILIHTRRLKRRRLAYALLRKSDIFVKDAPSYFPWARLKK